MTEKQMRVKLVLGKYRVVEKLGLHFKVALGGSTTMTFDLPSNRIDLRLGDLLTFYTEAPMKELTDADAFPPPVE